jgi:hypothetical protein
VNSGEWINSLYIVHVACEQWRVLHCSLGSSPTQNERAESGPVPKKFKKYIYFWKFVILLRILLLNFV